MSGKVPVKVNNVNFETMFNNRTEAPGQIAPQRQYERNFVN